jgi:hypothetical protein
MSVSNSAKFTIVLLLISFQTILKAREAKA